MGGRGEPVVGEWPLVGRDAELAVVLRCLGGRGAVVAGAGGVGKTRLAREAAAAVRAQGRPVEQVAATRSSQSVPLAPFARFRGDAGAGGGPGSGAETEPLVALRQAIVADHRPGDTVLVVDDAHLLDDASAAVAHELCASGAATILATVRHRERAPDAVTALWKDDLCERVELQPLAHAEVAALLAAALAGPVDNATTYMTWERSRGNVMHVRELVREGLASGALCRVGGLWAWTGELQAPPRLVELLGDRLGGLDRRARRAVDLLALAEPLAWPSFVALVPEEQALALVAEGLVEVGPSGRPEGPGQPPLHGDRDGDGHRDGDIVARLAHPLVGDVLQAELPEPARRRLLADLARVAGPGADPVRAATWCLDGGVPASPDLLVRAARDCAFVDARVGERFARAALAAPGVTAHTRVEAAVALAQHLMLSHRAEAADAALAAVEAADLAVAERVQVAVSRANILTWGLGRPDDAVAHLDRSADAVDAPGRRVLASHAVPMLVYAARAADAVARSEGLWADPEATAGERLRSALGEVPALVALGRPERALARGNAVLPLVPECRDELPVALGQLASGITLAQMLSGDLAGAEALMRPGYEEGVARDIPLLRGGAALRLGQVALWRGRPARATGLLREAVLALRQADAGLLAWAADTMRMAAAVAGQPADVAAAGEVAGTALRFPLFVTEARRADAAVAAAAGEVTRARACLQAGLGAAREQDQPIQQAVLLFDLARYGGARAAARDLATLPPVEGALAALMRDAVVALAEPDGPALDGVSLGFEGLGYDLFAAELARAAAGAHGATGLRARERQADARADAVAARCEGAVTPLLPGRPGADVLTAREREVARLAAGAMSDRDIARRLGLSPRTVETHLHRAYAKLGIDGRAQLPGVL